MNLLKSPFRRTTAVVAGSLLGMAGVFALAGPASAHHPVVSGTTDCINDKSWTIDWSVGNDYDHKAIATSITVLDAKDENKKLPLTGALADERTGFAPSTADKPEKQVHGLTEVTDPAIEAVQITVIFRWSDGKTNDGVGDNVDPVKYTVQKPGECGTPEPTTPTPTTPAPSPSESTPGVPVPVPSTSTELGEPTPIYEEDCTTITIGLDNTKGDIDFKLHFKTSKGEERDLSIPAGAKETTKFSATNGFVLTVTTTATYEGESESQTETLPAFEQGEDCDNSGSGGGLPVTGAAAGGIAGGAAALLAAGIVLFVMARRRKVKFTA